MDKWLKFKSIYGNFSKTQRLIADYFMQNPHTASGKTLEYITERLNVSKSTLVRFSKSVGFEGYRDFMLWFSVKALEENDFTEAASTNYYEIKAGDSIEKIIGHIFQTSKESITQTMEVCDILSVKTAVELMQKAKRIDFFGMGSGAVIANDAQQKFIRINKICYAFPDNHSQATVAATLKPDDVCILISYSGETHDTIRVGNIAKSAGASIISITKYGDNSISQLADVKLFVSTPESEIRPAATGSRISQLCIIDMLYTGVLSKEYDNVKQYLDASASAAALAK